MNRLFLFYCLIVGALFSQLAAQKNTPSTPGLNIEDELNLNKVTKPKAKDNPPEKKPKDEIVDKDTTVEGDDEQYAPPRKSEIELPKISEGQLSRWEDEVRDLTPVERQGTKNVERKAQIKTEYGTQNSLGAAINITKKDDFGAYLIEYKRNKQDYEAQGLNVITNSALSHDALKLIGQLNFSPSYKMLLRTEYLETTRGLQANSNYGNENKKLGIFQWDNQIRPDENQRITTGISGNLAQGVVTQTGTTNTTTADFQNIKASLEWQYIFGERNALTISGDLWYGQNTDYQTATPQYYRGGNAEARNVFPLARFLIGESNQALQIDATVGAKIFFAQGFEPVIGPKVALDFFYPGYQGTLEIERSGVLPDVQKYFFTPLYQTPYRYSQAEDLWKAAFKNNFHLTKETHLKVSATLLNYIAYFDRRLDAATGLLQLTPMSYRAVQASASLAQNFGTLFYHDTGISGEYFIDHASLREPIAFFTRLHFTPHAWDLSVDLKYVPQRRQTDFTTLAVTYLNDYVMLGAGVEYTLLPAVKIFVRGENLLNQKWQVISPYQMSGARGWFGLNMVF